MADGGISITIDVADLKHAEELISRLADLDENELLTTIGAQGESQTRRRIESEKTAPDGKAWAPNWPGTSILMATGQHLLGSIAYIVSNGSVEWGSSWPLSVVHQEGRVIKPKATNVTSVSPWAKRNGLEGLLKGKKLLKFWVAGGAEFGKGFANFVMAPQVTIPKREFVGLSSENRDELEHTVTDFLGSLLQ